MATNQSTDEANGNGTPGSTLGREEAHREFEPAEERHSIYECRVCDNIALTVSQSAETMTCHGRPMREVTDWEIDVEVPQLRQVLLDAFGLPKVGLDICLCVIGEGPLSPGEVAEHLDYDRSTVSRYLNDLVEVGLLEKSQLNREGGGVINVYHSIDVDRMRRETLVGFYVWAGAAASLIEEANAVKEEHTSDDHGGGLQDVFWEEFQSNAGTGA